MNVKFFVYGTLLQGMKREGILKDGIYLGPAITQADLYDIGDFPGIQPGSGTTVGEVYSIKKDLLNLLDRIEGYSPSDLSSSLFIRKSITVRDFAENKKTAAFTYFFNNKINGYIKIPHGDYRRYLLEKESKNQWIISYGSNMNFLRLYKRIGEVCSLEKGFLKKFKLIFNKQANQEKITYANVVYTGVEDRCPIIATQLSPHQIKTLDVFEGVPHHYLRIGIHFYTELNQKVMGQMYIAHPTKLTCQGYPEPHYIEYIRTAYKEYGFDENILPSLTRKKQHIDCAESDYDSV